MTNFVSLHNQTYYSILDSIISPKDLFLRAKELNQPAIAVTDHGTLAATWDSLKASRETGVKLIIGCECYFLDDASVETDAKFRHVILLAKNAIGYRNLLTVNKKGFDQGHSFGKRIYPIVDWKLLEEHKEGLICLTACGNGIVSQLLAQGKFDEADNTIIKLKGMFGDNLGLEIQPNNMQRGANIYNDKIDQNFLNRRLIDFGKKHNVKVVPACNSHYLTKDDAKTHDVFLAIGSHQPVYSNFRLKYNVPEFYLKSGDEVKAFFARNWGEEFAQQLCDNTIYFADLCEVPDWIDPKYSNPSGKELPVFPVKDEPDYGEFLEWSKVNPFSYLKEDAQFLRYKCSLSFEQFKKTLPGESHELYSDRINSELEVLEYQGFSSYMLIVADYVNWCIKNDIPVGPGRGCVSKETEVLTEMGYKNIDKINIGEKVFTHNGTLQRVLNKFNFPITNEKLLKIKSQLSFDDIIATKDHKFLTLYRAGYVSKRNSFRTNWDKTDSELKWVKAEDLSKNHLMWTQYPNRNIINKSNEVLDLSQYVKRGTIKENYIEYKYNRFHKFSISNIMSETNLGRQFLVKIKNKEHIIDSSSIKRLISYLQDNSLSLEEWQNLDTWVYTRINKNIILDEDFYFILGLWVGDGFLIHSESKFQFGIGFSLHAEETELQNKIINWFAKYGFVVSKYKKKNEKAVQIEICNELIFNLFKNLFPNYQHSSCTKHLPLNFRKLRDSHLYQIIDGLINADGFVFKAKESIKTTSKNLALEIKETLLYLKYSCGIFINDNQQYLNKDGANRKTSYNISFNGFYNRTKKKNPNFYKENGYFSRITSVTEIDCDMVYDIEVENDHSYLTSNYISHNSVAGCFVAFLLNIHKADSIKYGLIFERFQNKLRAEAPDVDQDVSTLKRQYVLEYLRNKYGHDNMCSISNYNTITPKIYIKDVARATELGGSKEAALKIGNELADMISADISHSSFSKILQDIPLLSAYCEKYPELIKNQNILTLPRNASQHAAGIVVSQRPLVGLVPIRKEKDGTYVIEYDKVNTEQNGLVKMDVLGLSTLDLIGHIIKLIREKHQFNNEHLNYDANDEKTYELISKGDTFGVFQFGTSSGTIDLCKKIKPKNIEDLAIITTLARPAAANIRSAFIKARENNESLVVLHPSLEPAFKKTFGFGLFDESILQLGKDVAGWSYNDADRIRKMIKDKGKNPDKDKKLKEEFIKDAIKNGINELIAVRIFNEEVSKFKSYTFNKSHAIVYSFISYQTAYLKAHFPIEFLLGNLMAEVQSNSPVAKTNMEQIKKELRKHKSKLLPPNINTSKLTYTISNDNVILTGLDALKFVSDDAIKDIISKRPFKNFFDFMARVDSRKVRSNTIQALAASGALDSFKIPRKSIYLYCSDYRKKLQVWLKKHDPTTEEFIYPWTEETPWKIPELYALEQHYLNEAFICKPPAAYGDFFSDDHKTILDVKKAKDKTKLSPIKGIIRNFFEFKVKKEGSKYLGQSMIKAVIEDKFGNHCSCTIFPDRWTQVQKRIKEINKKANFDVGIALSFMGSTNSYEDDIGIILDQIYNLALPPALPADLKAKKVNLKQSKAKTKEELEKPVVVEELIENIIDSLYDEGLVDLDENSEND